jgi:hypothetical protein
MRFHGTKRDRAVWVNIQQRKARQGDQPWRGGELFLGVNWENAYDVYGSKSAIQEGALGTKGGQWYRRP